MIVTKRIEVKTEREGSILNISRYVEGAVRESKLKDGIVTVFVVGSTAAVTTMEYEEGLLKDFPSMLDRIIPKGIYYEHERAWHDGNGHSHLRASLIGPSITIPFINNRLTLGTWQQIVLIELDIRARKREIIIQVVGE